MAYLHCDFIVPRWRDWGLRLVWVALVLGWMTGCASNIEQVETGSVLFQDDFSSNISGWDRRRAESGITDYEHTGYRIWVASPQTELWATPGLNFRDVRVDVDALKLAGPNDNDLGIVCRYQDRANFYFMVITSDGYYGIIKMRESQPALLGGEMKLSEAIHQGEALNHIRAECIGPNLSLWVNDQHLDTQEDREYTTGDVGLIAGAFGEPGVDILFDNFTVLKP